MSLVKSNNLRRSVLAGIALALLGLVCGRPVRAQTTNPVPLINLPLVPDATAPGGPQFTLTVNGTGFVSNATVNWNGSPLATTFVSGSQLTAIVPASDIATANTGWVTVVNPAPGGGTSNVAFFTVTANTGNSVAFTLASPVGVGVYPVSVAVGDFNGDGKLDLAVANMCSPGPLCTYPGTLSILLGDGAGNFSLASSPTAGTEPSAVAVGDFNGDGNLDLAVADWGDFASVFLGDGTGNFTLSWSSFVGYCPQSVAVGDFNGDGNLDLAVANECSGSVSILLGDGTGNFTLASSPAVGSYPYSVAVGDFNGDGHLDLAVANEQSNTVSILLGDGTGNFTLASSPAVGLAPASVAVGDFNGDGNLDLAVANMGDGTLSILLGDGTGNFTLASAPAWNGAPVFVAVGDFNGDDKLDLAVVSSWGLDTVDVLLGDGTGNFTLASTSQVGSYPWSVGVGDFNNDGRLDLAATNKNDNTVSVLLQVPPSPAVTLSPTSLSFGTQLIGTSSSSQTVALSNTGTATLDINSVTASANFAETNTCGTSLTPGASCTITVIFQPRNSGALTGTISINDNASNSPQTIVLTGTGTLVGVSPAILNFNTQPVGTTSAAQTITVTNNPYRALTIASVHISGADSGDFAQTNTCGTGLPAGGTCTISITFTPQATGSRRATLGISDSAGGPQTVPLKGYGTE